METYSEMEHANTSSVTEEAGSSAIRQIVELTPVPYAGETETITIIQGPISEFMLRKPA